MKQQIKAYLIQEECSCGKLFNGRHDLFDHIYNQSDSYGDRNHRRIGEIRTEVTK